MRRAVGPRFALLSACCALGSGITGCTPSSSPLYAAHLKAADTARERADYGACALELEQAAKVAPNQESSDESNYRAAGCYARGGRDSESGSLLRKLAAQPGARQARASYDLAFLELSERDNSAPLRAALLQFPNAGQADRGFKVWLKHVATKNGAAAALSGVDELKASLQSTELEEERLYERAKLLEALQRPSDARAQFLAQLERFPYPKGRYWDAATLRAAALSVELHEPERAAEILERMLTYREEALITGSYERGYGEAQFQLAKVYALSQPQKAYAAYLSAATEFPTSLRRDDAAWAAARLAQSQGNGAAACNAARTLQQVAPESAYVPCLPHVCAALSPSGNCHEYLLNK